MLTPAYTKQFKRDVKLLKRSGKDTSRIKEIILTLIAGKLLDKKYRDHKLVGNFRNRRECQIEPDWLLVFVVESNRMIFERTGSHSDLFK